MLLSNLVDVDVITDRRDLRLPRRSCMFKVMVVAAVVSFGHAADENSGKKRFDYFLSVCVLCFVFVDVRCEGK